MNIIPAELPHLLADAVNIIPAELPHLPADAVNIIPAELPQLPADAVNIIPAHLRKTRKNSGCRVKRLNRAMNRVLGKTYETGKLKIVAARGVKGRCGHKVVKSIRSFHCFQVSDEMREKCCSDLWKLSSWNEKKSMVKGMVTTREALRRQKRASIVDKPKRNAKKFLHEYYLPCENGNMVKVCNKFFLHTLHIGQKQLHHWLSDDNARKPNSDMVNRANACNKSDKDSVKEWIEQIPKVPSHYCRANTSRLGYVLHFVYLFSVS